MGLEAIAEEVLNRLPPGAPQSIAESLRQPTKKALSDAGMALLEAGELDLAESLYRMLSNLSEGELWPLLGVARVALRRGEPSAIVDAWSKCLQRFPDRAEPSWYLTIALGEHRMGNYSAAEEVARRGTERFPDYAALYAATAEALLVLGRNEEAVAGFRHAVHLDSGRAKPRSFIGIAQALRAAGRLDEEKAAVEELTTRFPDEPSVLSLRAQDAARKGELDVAESLYRRLIDLSETDLWPVLELARIASRRGEPSAIVDAWSQCLGRFPERAEPSWYLSIALAEHRTGNYSAAEEQAHRGTERFPDYAPLYAARGEALLALSRNEEAIAAFRAAVRLDPDGARPRWFIGIAQALRAAGRLDEEKAAVEDMAVRFPDDPSVLTVRAQDAERRQDWWQAYMFRAQCLRVAPQPPAPTWVNSCARALLAIWRPEEALDMWRALRSTDPDFVLAYSDAATTYEDMGRYDIAQKLWTELIARNPVGAKLDWYVRRARCMLNQPFAESLEPAIREIESVFPDSPMGRRLSFEAMVARNQGFDAVSVLVEDAVRRFPEDRSLLVQQVQILLAAGRTSEAEDIVERLESTGEDAPALIARWHVLRDRGDISAMREWIQRALTDRLFMVSGIVFNDLLLDRDLPSAKDQAFALCEDLARRLPGRISPIVFKARILLELLHYDEALKLIDAVPPLYRSLPVQEFRAWAAAHRGNLQEAQEIWKDILGNSYFPAIHSPEPVLNLVSAGRETGDRGGVIAFVPVRDEMPNLPAFLAHHRRLGVRRFVFVDNESTDGTGPYLMDQPDVTLYRTADSFPASGAGMRWINFLIDRHGQDGWCLFLDADEDFLYPGWETTPLDRLISYLDGQGAEAMPAFMLDVYPERLIDSAGRMATREDCVYFDSTYVWRGMRRPPYRRPDGGIRERLFGSLPMSHKVPLTRSGRGVYLGNHETTPMRFAEVSGVLAHYKMVDLFTKAGQHFGCMSRSKIADRALPNMRRYERYAARLESIADIDLRVDGVSRPLGDSLDLADQGLMQAPPHYRRWLGTV